MKQFYSICIRVRLFTITENNMSRNYSSGSIIRLDERW